jgi:hypothetical protein
LIVAFLALSLGYFLLGNIQTLWPAALGLEDGALLDYTIPVACGLVLIAIGRSFIQPGLADSIRDSVGKNDTMGLGILYFIISFGSLSGFCISYWLRTGGLRLFPQSDGGFLIEFPAAISSLYSPGALVLAVSGLLLMLFLYRDRMPSDPTPRHGTGSRGFSSLLQLGRVLGDIRFVTFTLVFSLFWFLHCQLFNLVPLMLRFIDPRAPVELYALAGPVSVITFQLLVTQFANRHPAPTTLSTGILLATLAAGLNILPALLFPDIFTRVTFWGIVLPVAGVFLLIYIAALAAGEMLVSDKMCDYIAQIAPGGEAPLYVRFARLPAALGIIIGAPLGGALFERFALLPQRAGQPPKVVFLWSGLALFGLLSWVGLLLFNHFVGLGRDTK